MAEWAIHDFGDGLCIVATRIRGAIDVHSAGMPCRCSYDPGAPLLLAVDDSLRLIIMCR
jgi:hypothetical protein